MKKSLCILLLLIVVKIQAQELYQMPSNAATRWSSFENQKARKGAGGAENRTAKGHAFEGLKAGAQVTLLDYTGSGIIHRIWLTVADRSPEMLRSLKLEMFWDGASKPAVSVPLGDFFSISHGRILAFENALFSSPEGRSFNCIIPMPFRKGARIVIANESNKDLSHLFYDIDFTTVAALPKAALYFHCYWSRTPKTMLGKDFEILPNVKGKGRFLGANIGIITNPLYGDSWWGEGEVKVYLDGDQNLPTLVGTGAEDYVGAGWGLGTFIHKYQGCPVADTATRQWSLYRFHIPDPIYFNQNCKVTIQALGGYMRDQVREMDQKGIPLQAVTVDYNGTLIKLLESDALTLHSPDLPDGWVNFYREEDYCATAYFYLDKPVNELPTIVGAAQRLIKNVKNN